MAQVLHRLGMFTARRKWVVLGAWIIALASLIVVSRSFGSNTSNNLQLPGTDSQAASDLLAARFPPQQNGSNPLVFHTRTGKVTDAQAKQAIEASYNEVKKLPHVASAVDPFSQQGAAQISKDKQTTFIPVLLDVGGDELTDEIAQSVLDAGDPGRRAGMEVAVGGSVGSELSEPATESSEVIGLIAAMIILAFTFGTVVAMGLPIVSAVFGLGVGLSLIVLLGHIVTVPTIAPTLATMIGLGVGIDYALFLVTRHRANRAQGMKLNDSIALAVATSGSAIVFAGTTVVIALLTLIVAGIPLVTSLGYSSAFAVATAVLASITLLPAVLSLVGPHIESVRVPRFMRPKPKDLDGGFWGGWARVATTRPWWAVAGAIAILIPLIIPFFSLEFGQEDVGATPKSTTQRQAYDLMAEGFGVGYNGPLLVAIELGTPAKQSSEYTSQKQQADSLQQQLEQEQKQGKSQQQQLTEQANALSRQGQQLDEQQQGSLESEQANLERQANADAQEQAELQATANRLQADQVALTKQIVATGSEAQEIVRQGAKVTKELTSVVRRLAKNRAEQRKVEAQLKRAKPSEEARLEARLRKLEDEETRLERRLDTLVQQEQANREQSQALLTQARSLREKEVNIANRALALGGQAAALATDAVTLVKEKQAVVQQASNLQVQAAKLQTQAANLQTQAANLQTQQVKLQEEQQTAQSQQQQAEQLKTDLTNELTQAGGDPRGTDPRLVKLQDALSDTDGVTVVSPPRINKAGDAATISVVATTAPAATETSDLVKTLRTYTIPQATRGTNVDAFVGGQTASYVDLADEISSRLLLVILVVIGLSFCILLAAFRSLLFAVQAAVANILSVTAAFGVLTAVFQLGWGLSIVGLDTASGTDPIASYVPLMMFAVLFGLSMDYQVFLISKIEQHRAEGGSNREAIRRGLAAGARVIVAAALIMMSVFGSFILDDDPTVKQFGVGLSVGVALAAMTVLVFAPAVLVLAGKGSWWVPGWLDRILPHLDVEGAGAQARAPVATPRAQISS